MTTDGWYTIRNASDVDSPALIIYPDRVKNNLEILKNFANDPARVRPHVKTNKCPQVLHMMLAAGINKFKCATIAEAEILAEAGAKDILLAYQPQGPKVERYCGLQDKFGDVQFSCLVDNDTTLALLSAAATKRNQTIRVFADLNVGMNRTGILPRDGFRLYEKIRKTAHVEFIGLHAYDGHLRDSDLNVRTLKCEEAYKEVQSLRDQIKRASGKSPVMVAGGTPTFPIHSKKPDVESSPGTFIFWDMGYHTILPEQPFQFAALVISRVISKPDAETICVDLGHKSISSENTLKNRVYFLNATDLEPIGHSEEHMVLRCTRGTSYEVGDLLYGVPHHICPTVALYDHASICRDQLVDESWAISGRQRKITI